MSSPTRTFKNSAYGHLAALGKALSSGPRVELLELLAQAPRTVEALSREIEQSVANTSHHLRVLRQAQLVTSRRDGLFVVYALAGPEVADLLVDLQRVGQRHVAALERLSRDFFTARDALEPVDQDTLLDRLRAGEVTLIDVRPEHEFAAEHLPGALSVPLHALEAHLAELPRDRPVIAYCRGPFCVLSATAADRLRALGYDARRATASVPSVRAAASSRPAGSR